MYKDEGVAALMESELHPDPCVQFDRWYSQAAVDEMAVATVRPDGTPSCRMVLLKGHEHGRFVFYTNLLSDKAIDLALNSTVALLFRWAPVRQVRVVGTAREVPRHETEEYWRSRPYEAQLSAWASPQSRPVAGRGQLEQRVQELRQTFGDGEVPCPTFWGGYSVKACTFEFWQQGPGRLHDRFRYEPSPDGWACRRLGP